MFGHWELTSFVHNWEREHGLPSLNQCFGHFLNAAVCRSSGPAPGGDPGEGRVGPCPRKFTAQAALRPDSVTASWELVKNEESGPGTGDGGSASASCSEWTSVGPSEPCPPGGTSPGAKH